MDCHMDNFDKIDKYLSGKLAGAALEEFEEHIFNCKMCFQDLRVREEMAHLIKTEGHILFAEDLQKLTVKDVPTGMTTAVLDKLRGLSDVVRLPRPAYRWVGVAVVAVAAMFMLFRPDNMGKIPFVTRELSQARTQIQLLSPAKRSVVAVERPEFRWVGPSEISTYNFLLLDFNSDIVWEKETVKNRLTLPPEVALNPNMTYFWQVEGTFESGSTLLSVMASFTYKGNNPK